MDMSHGHILSPFRGMSLRRHAEGAVEADRLAVEHRVGDDLLDQLGVFGRAAVWVYPRLQRPMALLVVLFGALIVWSAWGFLQKSRPPALLTPAEQAEVWRNKISDDPRDVESVKNLGFVYATMQDMENAAACFGRAAALAPSDADALLFMGHIAAREKKYEKALEYYQKAAALPKDKVSRETLANLYFNIAYANSMLDNSAGTEVFYKRATAGRPDYFAAHYNLGIHFFSESMFDNAFDEFARSAEIHENDTEVLAALGLTSLRRKDYEKALAYYEDIIRQDPVNLDARKVAANINHLYLDKPEKAQTYFKNFDGKIISERLDELIKKLEAQKILVMGVNQWEPPKAALEFAEWAPLSTPALAARLKDAPLEKKKVIASALGASRDWGAVQALFDEILKPDSWSEDPDMGFDEKAKTVPCVLVLKWALEKCYNRRALDTVAQSLLMTADGNGTLEHGVRFFIFDLAREDRKDLVECVGTYMEKHPEGPSGTLPGFAGKAARTLGFFSADAMHFSGKLVALSRNGNVAEREAAFWALSRMAFEEKEIIDAYVEGLSDKEPRIRIAAANALAEMGGGAESAMDAVVRAADDGEAKVRLNAAFLFGVFEEGKIDLLEKLMDDPDDEVKTIAIEAIGKRESEVRHLIPELEKIIKTAKNEYVKTAAEDTLESIEDYFEEE